MDKAVIITGAGRGIGAATAYLAARRGYAVCVNYRQRRAAAEAVVHGIGENGGRAIAVGADVSVEKQVVRLFDTAEDEVAHVILWLLSDEASYVSGSFIDLAGGA